MSDYLNIVYNSGDRPFTSYPEKLVDYIYNVFQLENGLKLLEPGCGRGEHLRHFKNLGLDVFGLDLSPESSKISPDLNISIYDAESAIIPFPDNFFDVIYSKSFLEHLNNPSMFLREAYRVLKPGGILISMVPDWESQYKKFYDDYTHVSPFTLISLKNIQLANGFSDVDVFKFRQLPIVWKLPFLHYVFSLVAIFVPYRTKIPILRWSKELMLMSRSKKSLS